MKWGFVAYCGKIVRAENPRVGGSIPPLGTIRIPKNPISVSGFLLPENPRVGAECGPVRFRLWAPSELFQKSP